MMTPLADMIAHDELTAYLAKLADAYRKAAEALPTHAQFVDAMIARRAQQHPEIAQ